MAFVFGEDGAHLYLDGAKIDTEMDFTGGITENTGDLAIGANTWARSEIRANWRSDYFDGESNEFAVFDEALSNTEVYDLFA